MVIYKGQVMTDKEQIIIQGKLYNPCNGCELWDGEYCTGDKSYEPNGKIHGIICDRHIAEQFWKVRNELIHKVQECDFWKHQAELGSETTDRLAKQLEEREQECEELKEELAIYKKMLDDPEFKVALTDVRTGEREVLRKLGSKADRYLKALEEIEGYVRDNSDFDRSDILTSRTGAYDILDIINKAKEK